MIANNEKPIIAITGSAGKTTVKRMVASILRERWVVFESNDYNNTTEKTLEHSKTIGFIHRAAVLEYGMAYPGVITQHCSIIPPSIGIITHIGQAHIGNFDGNLRKLAEAKSELLRGMKPDGLVLLNADDENSRLIQRDGFQGRILTVGIEQPSDYRGENVSCSSKGIAFSLKLDGHPHFFSLSVLGHHNIIHAIFAAAVAHQLGFSPTEIQKGLANAKMPDHRLALHHLENGICLIDDTVHAHPTAMRAALQVLAGMPCSHKVAILGSMPELGEDIVRYHQELGVYAAGLNPDFLYTYGNTSVHIGAGAVSAGFPAERVRHWTTVQRKDMHRLLADSIPPDTAILVKGSSRSNMYETVKFLLDHFPKSSS